ADGERLPDPLRARALSGPCAARVGDTRGVTKSYLIDMDGVLLAGNTVIPGAPEFLHRLDAAGSRYLLLTNNPIYTPGDLSYRLRTIGLHLPAEKIFTSAMATASFL